MDMVTTILFDTFKVRLLHIMMSAPIPILKGKIPLLKSMKKHYV